MEQPKICEYLLNPAHRFGASKARFFAEFGFTLDAWEVLALALKEHGRDNEVAKMKETGFGPRCEIEGELAAPDGRRPRVRTVWQVDVGEMIPNCGNCAGIVPFTVLFRGQAPSGRRTSGGGYRWCGQTKGKLTGMAKKDPWDREDFWEVMLDGFDQLSIPDQISFWRKALRRGRQLCSTPS